MSGETKPSTFIDALFQARGPENAAPLSRGIRAWSEGS